MTGLKALAAPSICLVVLFYESHILFSKPFTYDSADFLLFNARSESGAFSSF